MKIVFKGEACGGASRFAKENVLPDLIEELSHIDGWPNSFVPGTFNILVDRSNWPQVEGMDFSRMGEGVKCLDRSHLFQPDAYLHYSAIHNNTLNPINSGEYGGDLQFWRATLLIHGIEEKNNCYMLRRVKSNYRDKIEIVSDCHLRSKYNLVDGVKVVLVVYDKIC